MKQQTLKEFVQFTKKKITEKEEMEEDQFFNQRDPEDKSREATTLEVFHGFCHMEERFHQAIKANDEKWKVVKRIDENRIVALTRMVRSQANRLRLLESSHKKVMEGNLTEIMEINKQIYGGEFKKVTNKAENELKKSEDAAKAAQDAISLWADEPELILEELDEASNQPRTPFPFVKTPTIQTPHSAPTTGPITPNNQGAQNGPRQKTKSGHNQPGNNNSRNKNKNTN